MLRDHVEQVPPNFRDIVCAETQRRALSTEAEQLKYFAFSQLKTNKQRPSPPTAFFSYQSPSQKRRCKILMF